MGGGELWDLTLILCLESEDQCHSLLCMAVWWREARDPPLSPPVYVTLGVSFPSLTGSVPVTGKWRS